MGQNRISHKGVVRSISDEYIRVEILSKSVCSECHAKMMCTASDMKVKNIDIKRHFYDQFEEGEEVNVSLTKTMGYKAVVISYLVPLGILLFLLLYLQNICASDLLVGLSCILGLGVYYFIVWLCRDKLANKFTFTIEKL